jgi:hypothetical protein
MFDAKIHGFNPKIWTDDIEEEIKMTGALKRATKNAEKSQSKSLFGRKKSEPKASKVKAEDVPD